MSESCHLRWSKISKVVDVDVSSDPNSTILDSNNSSNHSKDKIILNQVSGEAKPKCLTALMGPSGAGKTSLLDVLATRSSYNDGTIHLNQSTIQSPSDRKQFKRKIAYITQTDIFFQHLTVYDQLSYTALLRLSNDEYPHTASKYQKVQQIISLLRLQKCSNTPIKLLSGGERKRVNIGSELLVNPSLLLLDEPTSGLDSTSAVSLIKLLRSLAYDYGKTIICSIHQPSSSMFHSFDYVYFLCDGFCVFYGTPTSSLEYVQKLGYTCPNGYNAADHWMDLLVEDSTLESEEQKHDGDDDHDEKVEQSSIGPKSLKSTTSSNSDVSIDQDNSTATSVIEILPQEHDAHSLNHDLESNYSTDPTTVTIAKNVTADKTTTATATFAPKQSLLNRTSSLLSSAVGISRRSNISSIQVLQIALNRKRDEYKMKYTPKANLILNWSSGNNPLIPNPDSNTRSTTTSTANIIPEQKQQQGQQQQERKFNTSWFTQFTILLHRSMKNSRADILTKLNFTKSIGLALMAGLLWFQMPNTESHISDKSSFLFFSITYWIFDSAFSALFSFPSERVVLNKERASGSYHLSAYYLSKMCSELPNRVLLPFVYYCISYWMANVNSDFGVFIATACCVLLGVLAAESLGLMVGALVMDFETSMVVMTLLTLTMLAAGGFYVENIPPFVSWLKYLSPFKYSYDTCQYLVFNQPVACDGSGILIDATVCEKGVYASKEQVLEYLNIDGSFGINLGLEFVLIVVFRYMAFWALKVKKMEERSS